jgi:hypothetical protein
VASNFNSQAVINLLLAIRSDVSKLGIVDQIMGHEPKSAPGATKTFALWMGAISPVPALSGLAATAGRVVLNGRLYFPFLGQAGVSQGDLGETTLMHAVLELIASFSGGITVGGTVLEIDLLGAHGVPLEASPVGYLEQDGTHYRVAELTVPVIIDALWTQVD